MKFQEFISRRSWLILIAAVLVVPVVFWGAGKSLRSNENKVEDWLPSSFPETSELRWFREHFSADRFVIIGWDGCEIGDDPDREEGAVDDPRIEQLAKLLVPPAESPNAYSAYFQSVTTARRVLTELTSEPLNVPYDVALERLKGAFLGPDGRQTCVIATMNDKGVENVRKVLGRGVPDSANPAAKQPGVIFSALQECGISMDQARLAGPSVGNVAIDEEGEKTLLRLVVVSLAVGLGLAWWSLRSVLLTTIVFGCGILSSVLALALVSLTGQNMDAVMLSMPSLVYVLAISGAVHLVNHYRDALVHVGPKLAPGMAIAHGWKPALLCSVTTAIGLISLAISDLEPIRKFGIYSAAGVMGMLVVLFLFLPAALTVWPVKLNKSDAEPKSPGHAGGHGEGADLPPELLTWIDRIWGAFGGGIIRHHALVALGCVIVVGAVGYGLVKVRTNIDLLKLFDKNARILQDYAWLESRFGRLVPMEVVLRFPREMQEEAIVDPHGTEKESEASRSSARTTTENLVDGKSADGEVVDGKSPAGIATMSFLERMESIALSQGIIERRFGASGLDVVGKTVAVPTFAPVLPDNSTGMANFVERSAVNTRLTASRDAFIRSGYFRIDPEDGSELWRISLRVAALQGVDYGTFVTDLQRTVQPVVEAHRRRQELLKQIISRRGQENYAGAPVLLWYSPKSKGVGDQAPMPDAAKGPSSATSATDEYEVYAEAMKELMTRERMKIRSSHADPRQLSLHQLDQVRKFAAIILVGDFSPYDVSLIKNLAPDVILSQPHRFASSKHEPVAGQNLDQTTLSAVYTGLVPIVYKAQRVLLNSLIESTIWSFATIAPLMMFVCRSIPAGAVVMLPNVLPVLMIFGGMGWMGIEVDIGSMMSASIALGVAVDDTIHFLSWFKEDLARLGDRHRAILAAYRRCATPTLQASMISGLGLSVFCFSSFTPTARFGWLMLTILLAGVVAELVMLPAILAGPLGVVFKVPKKKTPSSGAGNHGNQVPAAMTGDLRFDGANPELAVGELAMHRDRSIAGSTPLTAGERGA